MAAFGSVFSNQMAVTWYRNSEWEPYAIQDTQPLPLHPGAHVLHYASTCFEGLKAYRWQDGSVRIFRLDQHVKRMQQSAQSLMLPVPAQVGEMVRELVHHCRADVPDFPGALYIRPTLIGTMPNIGGGATKSTEACLFVIVSPVGDYFANGLMPLRILVDDMSLRTTPRLGMVKTGGNYAAALGLTLAAKEQHGVDQVLFCPDGVVQETGTANFFLLSNTEILTKPLDSSFLHGVTRDSVLMLARDFGYRVNQHDFTVAEMLEWVRRGEAALSGTAAILASVGALVYRGVEIKVGGQELSINTERLRTALVDIQYGKSEDRYDWLTEV